MNKAELEPESEHAALERLFVAVPCPPALLEEVQQAQEGLGRLPGLRLLGPEQLHVTLAFIGGAPPEKREAARRVLRETAALSAGQGQLGGVLPLPSSRRARVVALAIEDQEGVFGRLFEAVMGGLEGAGVMQREKRPFRPHLTIARLKQPLRIEPKSEASGRPYEVQSVCLYRSELRREGARYTIIERVPLARTSVDIPGQAGR
jgi:2'-5' RNA ligase